MDYARAEVMEQIKDADILMTSFCGVTRAMLEAGKNLKLVFMMRSGWENCNVKAAKELGIPSATARLVWQSRSPI